MSISLPELAVLSREVVLEHGRGLDVVSVTTSGDNERVEVTVDIGGCHEGPCRFVVNVTRADAEQFHREFSSQLSEALHKHGIENAG